MFQNLSIETSKERHTCALHVNFEHIQLVLWRYQDSRKYLGWKTL